MIWGVGRTNPVSYTHLDVYKRQIVKFAEDCGEIDIEFGEEALFTVNASGQGKLNLKYNTDLSLIHILLRIPLKAKSRTRPMARTNWADTPCKAAAST